ncbi:uncharacterized protein LOC107412287 [Ziziphus jujuba]|uniref:Uncharacterized protein LOC107412287 n=1 Tax=Ziziphus jujuba TaxID=326968 RepID=A0A6P3ZPI1_ZIZJJ|nr:uncharacterized protein LOC107412287 [Ziziphus jujuba]
MAPISSSSTSIQLLEINMISAQDLSAVSKSMRTFAVAWLNPNRKLTTRVDQNGHKSPTWNEKFVFRVDTQFLDDENSTLTIEIYESAWLRDIMIGSVTVMISDLVPAAIRSQRNSKMRYVALQIRRPSGRPKGILNVGVTLLDGTMRSMPLYSDVSASAVEFWDSMDVKEKNSGSNKKMLLQRSKSERTDDAYHNSKPARSVCNGSMLNGSMINGSSSMVNGSEIGVGNNNNKNNNKGGGGGMGSICSDVGPSPSVVAAAIAKGLYPIPHHNNNIYNKDETGSSILDDWTEQDDSVEGLKTKIERWRTELPPIYDHYQNRNYRPENHQLHRHLRPPIRTELRKKKTGGALFSCFIFGCEFSLACGGSNPRKKRFNGSSSELTWDDDIYV